MGDPVAPVVTSKRKEAQSNLGHLSQFLNESFQRSCFIRSISYTASQVPAKTIALRSSCPSSGASSLLDSLPRRLRGERKERDKELPTTRRSQTKGYRYWPVRNSGHQQTESKGRTKREKNLNYRLWNEYDQEHGRR